MHQRSVRSCIQPFIFSRQLRPIFIILRLTLIRLVSSHHDLCHQGSLYLERRNQQSTKQEHSKVFFHLWILLALAGFSSLQSFLHLPVLLLCCWLTVFRHQGIWRHGTIFWHLSVSILNEQQWLSLTYLCLFGNIGHFRSFKHMLLCMGAENGSKVFLKHTFHNF